MVNLMDNYLDLHELKEQLAPANILEIAPQPKRMRANTLEEVGILREHNDEDSSSKSQNSSVKMNKEVNSHVKEECVSFITLQAAHKNTEHHPQGMITSLYDTLTSSEVQLS